GLALRATATAEIRPDAFGVQARVPADVDPVLAVSAARRILDRANRDVGLEVFIDSEIPISRGLKSSSAVANAVGQASARALGLDLDPQEILLASVDAAIEAGVTITGAFDDACASLYGGICLTDNRTRRILAVDRFPMDLLAIVHIPRRRIRKLDLKGIDFAGIRPAVEAAFHLALRGDCFHAIDANSAACAPLLGVLGALSSGTSEIRRPLRSEDTDATLDGVVAFGAHVDRDDGSVRVDCDSLRVPNGPIDARNSGTTLRLLAGVASLLPGATTLTGDSSLQKRPMGPLLDALRVLGADAISLGGGGRPPVQIRGILRGGSASLPGDVSSQFLSSLLIAGPLAAQGVEIRVMPPVRSEPYVELTRQMMRRFGVDVTAD